MLLDKILGICNLCFIDDIAAVQTLIACPHVAEEGVVCTVQNLNIIHRIIILVVFAVLMGTGGLITAVPAYAVRVIIVRVRQLKVDNCL